MRRKTHRKWPLRDTWHRTLVYFGLAEDDAYDEELEPYSEPEVELQDTYRDRPNVRRLSARRRRDEIDDIFADDPGPRAADRAAAPGRRWAAAATGADSGDVRVHFVAPKNFNDVQDVADKFKDAIPVILNLQGTDTDLSKRLIDFSSGLTYALDGGMQRIADKVFLLTPQQRRGVRRGARPARREGLLQPELTSARVASPRSRPGRGCVHAVDFIAWWSV